MPDHIAQTARQERLELLYRAGLWQQHLAQQEGITVTTESP